MTDLVCVVTGTNTYQFLRLSTDLTSFEVHHTQLRPPREDISTDYTCHVWTKDSMQLVVCTANGDVMLVNHSGEFLLYLPQSPEGNQIDCIFASSHGFMIGGENGHIWTFASQDDEHIPYVLSQTQPLIRSE